MQTSFQFTHFKDYAQFLLDNHLDRLARNYYELMYEARVPLLSMLEHLNDQQRLQIAKKSVSDFLHQVIDGSALEASMNLIRQWSNNEVEHFTRESIGAADILLTYSVRRKLYLHALPLYTSDLEEGIRLMQEFEDFVSLVKARTYEVYEQIQQEALRKERNLFESVISHSVDGIIAFDKELRIQAFNKVLEQHNGLPAQEVIGKKVFEVFPGYADSDEGKAFLQVLKGEKVYLKDRAFKQKEGYYDAHVVPLFNKKGEVSGGLSIVHDISLRKQQEDALRQKQQELQHQTDELQATIEELKVSNEELHTTREQLQQLNQELEERIHHRTEQLEYQRQWLYKLFMQVPGLIGILSGEEGTVVLFNDAFSRLWGGRKVLGLPMRVAWPELLGQGYFEFIEEVYRTGKAVSRTEYPGLIDRNNDGSLHQSYFNLTYTPYLNPRGEIEGVIIYGVDVTEQVESRRKVEQSEEKLSMALEAGQMGIWDYDPLNDQSNNSPLFHQIYGYTTPTLEWRFADYLDHLAPEYRAEVEQQFQEALANGILSFESKILKVDGSSGWVAVRGKVYYDEQQQPVRVVGIMLDISERKRAEEELQQSHEELKRTNTDLDNFIYTASHDLRSPMVNLEGLIQMLHRNLNARLQAQDLQLLEMMSTSINRLKRTIDGLTDITRIQKEDEVRETLTFEQIMQEVIQDLDQLLQESGAEVTVSFGVDTVEFAPHNLRSIFYNLLSNAIKYRKPDEPLRIQISTTLEEGYTVLSVEDNGLGISEANQKKLFSMFKRFHSHVRGSGIGLYLVKRIIENAGGKVEACSQEGVGSRFLVYFPG